MPLAPFASVAMGVGAQSLCELFLETLEFGYSIQFPERAALSGKIFSVSVRCLEHPVQKACRFSVHSFR